MFLKYLDPLWQPFRWVHSRIIGVRNVKGKFRVDVQRVKNYKSLAKFRAQEAKQMAQQAKEKAKAARGRFSGPGQAQIAAVGGQPIGAMAAPGRPPAPMAYQAPAGGASGSGPGPRMAPGPGPGGFPPGPGAPPGAPPAPGGAEGIVVTGALWWKKHFCAQCGQRLDKTWDRCPYCTGALPAASRRTQAIMVDAAGAGNGLQLVGWLVPLKGPQRGELFTLDPITSVGTDPSCTVVLTDSYMSSRHCEIRAEGGIWVLRDLKSTNGTYVNDKRVEQHELVDSDFVRVGQSVMKFKSL